MSTTQSLFQFVSVCARLTLKALSLATCFVLIFFAASAPAQQYGSMSACAGMSLGTPTTNGTIGGNLNGFVPFPASNAWNTNIANASLDPNSATLAAAFPVADLHPDFGQAVNGYGVPDNGIPYIVVDSTITPAIPITLWNTAEYGGQEDVVVAPYPANAPIEGAPTNCEYWPQSPNGDSHVLVLDRAACWLYETYGTTSCNGQYEAETETIWDMANGESRPWGWTSADAAGLSIFSGLVRYDEAISGTISHAFRFTMEDTEGDSNDGYFVLPASHAASSNTTANLLPMGTRLRLRATTPISSFSTLNQTILTAMMNYGLILADNGGNFFVQGTPDARWSDSDLGNWHSGASPITPADFDVILMTPEYPGMDSVSAYTDYPGSVPVINSFTATDSNSNPLTDVQPGDAITFNYTVTGDSYDYIDNIGPVRLTSGSGSVTITPTQTQEFTLYSTNATGQATSTIDITMPSSVVAPPVFTPPPSVTGVISAAKNVTISTPTSPSATIYYTLTNGTTGTTPTTASKKYNGTLLTVDSGAATQTVEAIAVVSGYPEPSAASSATYTFGAKTATPTFSPVAGTYSGAQTVTISDTTVGTDSNPAVIYYTTNGMTPTTSSAIYSGPITVAVAQTVNAMATATGYANSAVGSAKYSFAAADTPTLSLGAGEYVGAQTVTITDLTPGAVFYYTLTAGATGTTPTTNSTLYTGPITIAQTSVLEAIATAYGYSTSPAVSAAYTLAAAAEPTFSPAAGSYNTGAQTVTISDTTPGEVIYYTVTAGGTGTVPTTASTVYSGPITVSASSVVEALAVAYGYTNSAVASAKYTLTIATPTFSPVAGNYSGAQTVTISESTPGPSIYFTTDGTTPTFPITGTTQLYSAPITVAVTQTVKAIGAGTGFTTSSVASATYTLVKAATPTFSPVAGSYNTGAQTVTISDTTPGAVIYYTVTAGTTGTVPTTNSTVYSGPITVSVSSVVEALVTAYGYSNSAVASAKYTLTIATPTFSPVAGNYSGAQMVTISESTPGVTIYYTTNGTTPTTSSAVYSGAITVAVTQTIKAIGAATGFTTSAVASATYTLAKAATPTFSPVAGSYNTGAQTVTISDTTPGEVIYYTITAGTTGTVPTTASAVYSGPITVSASSVVEALAVAYGYSNSAVASAKYTLTIATPTFSPVAGNYTGAQTVTISDTTPGPAIYFTTDGTTPTFPITGTTQLYTGPITVAVTQTVKAIGAATGFTTSSVASATYTLKAAAMPTFNPIAGGYSSAQTVTISDTTPGAVIYYTVTAGTTGTTPTTNSTVYSSAITVSASSVVEALAVAYGYSNSAVASAKYTLTIATPTFSPVAGNYTGAQTVTISTTTPSATIYYTVTAGATGTTPTTNSTVYTAPVTVSASSVVEAIAVEAGFTTSAVASAKYTIVAATPTFSPVAGTYYTAQTVTISDSNQNSTIYYTTNGTTPTTSSTVYTSAITVSATETVEAIATAAGYGTSAVGTAAYYIVGATPSFNPGAGTYTSAQTVTISVSTPGSTIYYTTNGTTPTTNSTVYTSAITVSATETVEAIATATGSGTSAVGSAAYTIQGATPTFSPVAGTYTGAQTVTISDTTPGSTIYYTTDGSTPTTSSTVYSSAITVSTSETVNAIATATGLTNSAVGSAAYTIVAVTPTFSPGTGNYNGPQTVTISSTTPSAAIYYTTDGSTPTYPITGTTQLYSGPITVSASETVNAIATATGDTNSAVGPAVYTLLMAAPTFSFGSGAYNTALILTISDTNPGATIYYTNDGSTPTYPITGTTQLYFKPFTVYGSTTPTTVNAIAVETGYTTSAVVSATYNIPVIQPVLTAPAQGSTLTSTSVTFAWTPGTMGTLYELFVGTLGIGTSNLYNSGATGATSATVTVPATALPVYARFYWLIDGTTWGFADYTFTASGTPTPAVILSPTPGTQLGGTSGTFTWSTGVAATDYEFLVGTTGPGSDNLYSSGETGATSATVTDLPSNGETVYVRLYSLINGAWQYNSYTYTASGSPTLAVLMTPTPGTTLSGTSVTFDWTPGNIATEFEFLAGTNGPGSSNLYNSGETGATSATVTDLPSNGQTVYVRLYSLINGAWQYTNYTYVASGSPIAAALTTPTPNTTTPLTGTSVTFTWTPGNVATAFEFWAGTLGPGSTNLYNSNETGATSATVTDLPSNGSTVYVRLYSLINGVWQYTNYTYIAE